MISKSIAYFDRAGRLKDDRGVSSDSHWQDRLTQQATYTRLLLIQLDPSARVDLQPFPTIVKDVLDDLKLHQQVHEGFGNAIRHILNTKFYKMINLL